MCHVPAARLARNRPASSSVVLACCVRFSACTSVTCTAGSTLARVTVSLPPLAMRSARTGGGGVGGVSVPERRSALPEPGTTTGAGAPEGAAGAGGAKGVAAGPGGTITAGGPGTTGAGTTTAGPPKPGPHGLGHGGGHGLRWQPRKNRLIGPTVQGSQHGS